MALSVVPKLYPLCKFLIPIHFTAADGDGIEVDYTDSSGDPPEAFFAGDGGHDAVAAHANFECVMTYSGAGGIWYASIEADLVTYALLLSEFGNPADHASPGSPPILIMIVPSSSRDYATGAWYSKREALAA